MKRILLCALLAIVATSCSSEDIRIKKALKSSIPEDAVREYKLKDFAIVETILDANLRDSIIHQESRIATNEMFMKSDSTRLLSIQDNISQCKYQQATTLSWLRSSYNDIIRTYVKMENEIIEKLNARQAENNAYKETIRKYEEAISASDSPIIYYKIRHNYSLRGAIRDTILTLDSHYQLVQ